MRRVRHSWYSMPSHPPAQRASCRPTPATGRYAGLVCGQGRVPNEGLPGLAGSVA